MTLKERYDGVTGWFSENMPVAESELHYDSPYQLLVAVILSAQCTDKRVNMTTPALFEAFPTPAGHAAATPEEIYPYIRAYRTPTTRHATLPGMARHALLGVRRRGAERPYTAAAPAGRWPQDGQCRGSRDMEQGGYAGRYPCIPRVGTHRPYEQCPYSAADRAATRETYSVAPAAQGPSLAHTSWPLCVHGPFAEVRECGISQWCRYFSAKERRIVAK